MAGRMSAQKTRTPGAVAVLKNRPCGGVASDAVLDRAGLGMLTQRADSKARLPPHRDGGAGLLSERVEVGSFSHT